MRSLKKYKELLQNVGLLTLSNFGSKFLSFFLIPLYTAVLTTEEYGNFDFINVTISLLVPLLTLNVYEGALRFLLDKKNKKDDICKISVKYLLLSVVFLFILATINYIFNIIPLLNRYFIYFVILYITSAFLQFAQNITRGFDKISYIAISGVINSVVLLTLNILFLLVFHLGIDGYFLAAIISSLITVVYLFISIKFHKYLKKGKYNLTLQKEVLDYSRPLVFNSIGWWINNASDRYMVIFMCGSAANGIYSMAYKIPSILSILQNIFNQAWTITAVKSFSAEDEDNFIKNVYSTYNLLMVLCCSLLIILSKALAKFLYLNEFYNAWKYMPFLMISIVFGSLSGVLGSLFVAIKDSKIISKTTIGGATINIILNFILIKWIGVLGAAISTAISYFLVWLFRVQYTKKLVKIKFSFKKDLFVYFILLIQSVILLIVNNFYILYVLEILMLGIILISYKDIIKGLISSVKLRLVRR